MKVPAAATLEAATSHVLAPTDALAIEAPSAVALERAATRARRHGEFAWVRACVTIDALMLGAAVATAEVGAARAAVPPTPTLWLVVFLALVASLLWIRRMYVPRLALSALVDVRHILVATTLAGMSLLTLRVILGADLAASDQAVRLWAFATAYLVGGRALLSWSELAARRGGDTLRPTLIVGAGRVGTLTAERLLRHPELGLRPVGFLDDDPLAPTEAGAPLPVLGGASGDLERIVQEEGVEQVLVAFSKASHDDVLELARRCDELGVRVAFVPRLFDRMTERVTIEHVLGMPLISPVVVNPNGWHFALKHAFDRVVAAGLIVLLAPVLAVAAVGVRLSLGRPILFRQVRVGRNGRPFELLKFRTMRLGAGETASVELPPDTAPGGVEGEDLRTPFGNLLRRTSLDELPQLLNVLKGEMSLVGPRPERPEYVDMFGTLVHRYDDRHRVRAGITGWAQVHGLRGRTSISERAELDAYYVQNWSLWLDLRILLMTAVAVVSAYRNVE